MQIIHQGNLSFTEIHDWLMRLRAGAYCPLSGYAVAAVGRARVAGGADFYFAGVNVENADHHLSTHAEEGVLAAMVTALGPAAQLQELWTAAGPRGMDAKTDHPLALHHPSCCGKCRQQVAGFAASLDMPVHAFSLRGDHVTTTVGAFLPQGFTFKDVFEDFKRPAADTGHQSLTLEQAQKKLYGPIINTQEWLKRLKGFHPVTDRSTQKQAKAREVILCFANGQAAAGVLIEDAAFLSISAAQAALAISYAAGIAAPLTEVICQGTGLDALQHSDQQVLQDLYGPKTRCSFL